VTSLAGKVREDRGEKRKENINISRKCPRNKANTSNSSLTFPDTLTSNSVTSLLFIFTFLS
jgi:hypothetical protein